jgi:hypothetical protein
MAIIDVANVHEGQLLANYGTITRIVCTSPPPPGQPRPHHLDPTSGISTGRCFTLVDDSGPGERPRALISFDPYVQPLHPGMVLMNNAGGIPFTNLTCGSCPAGSQWTVETA